MAERKVITVNFEIPGGFGEFLALESDRSLLDADVVVYEPGIPSNHAYEEYAGKPLLTQSDSFAAAEALKHWRAELVQAVNSGKTVIIFLVKPEQVYVHTGEKQFSGTGRSRVTTNIVKPLDSYSAIPTTISNLVPKGGEVIQPAADLKYLASYWHQFGSITKYEVYFEGKFADILLKTRTGEKVVGATLRTDSGGTLLLLPPIEFDDKKLLRHREKEEPEWTKEAIKVGHQLLDVLIDIDKALKADKDITPAPKWTQASQWRLPKEESIESEISRVTTEIGRLRQEQNRLHSQLSIEGSLRRLLYEKGPQLESAVLDSLRLLGFKADSFKDAESEFDAVFIAEEGRLLGEVEGKDNRPLNIDKLSQLERNLQEDFTKEDVTEYAKGVLFGNAHRLIPPNDRHEYFTEKCITGAKRLKVALVRTPDLFPVVKYLKQKADNSYAKQCRVAMLAAEGTIVEFPSPPSSEDASSTLTATKAGANIA